MSEYGDYDIGVIKIDPAALGGEGKKLVSLVNEMGDSVVRINNTVAALQLGWVAQSADEAQEFQARWNRVMQQMFGDDGVLVAMIGGLMKVAVGFSHLEIALEDAFHQFAQGLASSGGGGSEMPKDHTGPEFPITQDYPN
ncbi:WXG100 family type VII secretion target [Streptomyces sp. NBC_01455]|uniref:WXG100 family type VII secretion target n=1 Tax=Streptomyces sp. NBC_01455 TaxID=2903874 RepID=UPI002E368BC5|nr:WXG100 family type VII secretion target [Streptomyces sp. NBC_01455]